MTSRTLSESDESDPYIGCGAILKIIAVTNQKGGCGKTTTAINLSACIAEKGHKVLLVDFDPQSHASIGMGLDVYQLKKSMYDVITNTDIRLAEVVQPTTVANLAMAPANIMLSGAELDLINVIGRESVLKDRLDETHGIYDYVFIDCPPSLGLLTVNALTSSQEVLIPVQTHYYPLEGVKQLLNTVNLVKRRLNHRLEILGFLPTLYDMRTNISKDVLKGIREHFGDKVFNTVINTNVKLTEAPSSGKPITHYAPESRGAQDYNQLAEEVLSLEQSKLQ